VQHGRKLRLGCLCNVGQAKKSGLEMELARKLIHASTAHNGPSNVLQTQVMPKERNAPCATLPTVG